MLDVENGRTATATEPSITSLVSGIVKDLQDLTNQQIALFKQEVKSDVRRMAMAGAMFGVGLVCLLIGALLLCIMLAEVIYWAAAATIPLWVCYGIVGGAVTIGGICLLLAGKQKLSSASALPEESVRALKENVQCLTNRR